MPNLSAIEERFDARAAQVLEDLIEDVEDENSVKVTGLTVDLVPDTADDPSSPAVEVNLTVERIVPQAPPQQGPGGFDVNAVNRAIRELR